MVISAMQHPGEKIGKTAIFENNNNNRRLEAKTSLQFATGCFLKALFLKLSRKVEAKWHGYCKG
jgi:hypothetical protein